MAYSTQKDFWDVAFLNQQWEGKCPKVDAVQFKTYASTADERAWSLDKFKQAQYLIDLVECRMYSHNEDEEDE